MGFSRVPSDVRTTPPDTSAVVLEDVVSTAPTQSAVTGASRLYEPDSYASLSVTQYQCVPSTADASQMLCGADTNLPSTNPNALQSATTHSACVDSSHTHVLDHEQSGFSRVPSDVMRVVPLTAVVVVVEVVVVDDVVVLEVLVVVSGPAP
jgi:hypothetical protein